MSSHQIEHQVFLLSKEDLDEVIEVLDKYKYGGKSYYKFGLHLGLSVNTLSDIEAGHKGDVNRCLLECLSAWLRRVDKVDSKGGPTWVALKAALGKLEENAVADGIEKEKLNKPVACMILTRHHPALFQSMKEPLQVAEILHKENVLPLESLTTIRSIMWPIQKIEILLSSLNSAISKDHKCLETFVSVLRTNFNTVPVADDIWREYENHYTDHSSVETMSDDESNGDAASPATKGGEKLIIIPRSWKKEFGTMRTKFAGMFFEIRRAILKHFGRSLKDLKDYLEDSLPHLRPRLNHAKQVRDILSIVREHCTLTDISILEGIVSTFNIKEAEEHIKTYKECITAFCDTIKTHFCFDETFQIVHSPSPLQCETATFKLDWKAEEHTIADVEDVIGEGLGQDSNVAIKVIDRSNSIKVICTFPVSLTSVLIARANENVEVLKKRGLLYLAIGYYTVYDCHKETEQLEQAKAISTAGGLYLSASFLSLSSVTPSTCTADSGYLSNNSSRPLSIYSSQETISQNLPVQQESVDVMIVGSFGTEFDHIRNIIVVPKITPATDEMSEHMVTEEISRIESFFKNNSEKYKIQLKCCDLPSQQQTTKYYLENIKNLFRKCVRTKVIIYYTGHGEKGTGNWCFKDGVITFQDIFWLYMKYLRGKKLTIISDSSYSGNWIDECAKTLDDIFLPSCGHYAREGKILLKIFTSCRSNEVATLLSYISEAIYYQEEDKKVLKLFGKTLSSGQTPMVIDFTDIRCSRAHDMQCGIEYGCTWDDRLGNKYHRILLVQGEHEDSPAWHFVLVDENMLDKFKVQLDTGSIDVEKYGTILYSGWGEKPPWSIVQQMNRRYKICLSPEDLPLIS